MSKASVKPQSIGFNTNIDDGVRGPDSERPRTNGMKHFAGFVFPIT